MEFQETLKSQKNLEKEEQSWRIQTSWFQTLIQSYSNQACVVLAKDTHTEQQNRTESLEINLYIYTQLDIDKEARTIQWGKQHSFQQMNN